MNDKLRLLVTSKCNNKCPLCCNNQFSTEQIPVVEGLSHYKEIDITGGEPLLFPKNLLSLLQYIREGVNYTGQWQTIYLYTNILPIPERFAAILPYLDGICYTPHNEAAALYFVKHAKKVSDFVEGCCSLRLNIFPEVENFIPDPERNFPDWKIKWMEWIENCPVPAGEDFRRLDNLW